MIFTSLMQQVHHNLSYLLPRVIPLITVTLVIDIIRKMQRIELISLISFNAILGKSNFLITSRIFSKVSLVIHKLN
ncbi:hypothetical protein QL285_059139 [Trifolium repens]|nr:hypothetical protein QL285_059139 [Trifolium repens]